MMLYFNTMSQLEVTQEVQERKIGVFLFNHPDGLNRLNPLIILEGEKIWKGAIKQRITGNPMYYIFFNNSAYMKLWKDNKNNLLIDIDNHNGYLFFDREPQIWRIDILLNELKLDDNSLTYNNVTLKFSVPIFSFVRKLNPWLDLPTALIIHKIFFKNT